MSLLPRAPQLLGHQLHGYISEARRPGCARAIVPIIEKRPTTQEHDSQRSLLYLAGLAKIEELIGIREEYEEWQSNLSENFASSQACEKPIQSMRLA